MIPNYAIIDLEFDNLKQAGDTLAALRKLWHKVEGEIIFAPKQGFLNGCKQQTFKKLQWMQWLRNTDNRQNMKIVQEYYKLNIFIPGFKKSQRNIVRRLY